MNVNKVKRKVTTYLTISASHVGSLARRDRQLIQTNFHTRSPSVINPSWLHAKSGMHFTIIERFQSARRRKRAEGSIWRSDRSVTIAALKASVYGGARLHSAPPRTISR